MNPNLYGFKIKKFLDLADWKVLEIDNSIDFSVSKNCPADNIPLKVLATLVSGDGSKKIRVGACSVCGYAGYIDRPSKNWFGKFYLETWDEAGARGALGDANRRREDYLKNGWGKKAKKEMVKFAEKYGFDKERYVLDVGCGYGANLKYLEEVGFKNLLGVETSRHRAVVAEKAYDLKVLVGPFEDSVMQAELKRHAPYGLIFSHHVLEHTYNPREIIAAAADLQKEGDFLIISLPNGLGEPSMVTLGFLPHLHAFRAQTLKNILLRHNYDLLDHSMTNNQALYVVARKLGGRLTKNSGAENKFPAVLEKFKKCLGLGEYYNFSLRRLWWYRRFDVGGQSSYWGDNFLEKIHFAILSSFNRYRLKKALRGEVLKDEFRNKHFIMQSAIVESLQKRFTSYSESPIEIQYEGNIKLFYK